MVVKVNCKIYITNIPALTFYIIIVTICTIFTVPAMWYLYISAITPLSVQGMEFESTVISDLSIQGLRDIGNLEVGTKTHVFVTTYDILFKILF